MDFLDMSSQDRIKKITSIRAAIFQGLRNESHENSLIYSTIFDRISASPNERSWGG